MSKNDSDNMDVMKDAFSKLKRMVVDPKVYALVVKTNRMAILHMGVYHSLDEAFAAVKQRAIDESGQKDASKLNLDMWMWEVMPATGVLTRFFGKEFSTQMLITKDLMEDLSTITPSTILGPTVTATEKAKQVYDLKNELMKNIIDNKDLAAFEEAKSFLSKSEQKLIHAKITQHENNGGQEVQ